MNVFPEWDPDETADVEFDQLCRKCMSLFKGDFWREPPRGTVSDTIDEDANAIRRVRPGHPYMYQAHHDINALFLSANESCHLCSLIADMISAEKVQLLQADLVNGRVEADEQIWINIGDMSKGASSRLHLSIHAEASPSPCMKPDGHYGNEVGIGSFNMFPVDAGVVGLERSFSVWNCSRSMLEQMISWSTRCKRTHTDCAKIQSLITTRTILPTRLLDLSTVSRDGLIRLIATAGMPPNVDYATLSHCWGGRSPKMLTTDSLVHLEKGIPIASLPRSFRDAVLITGELHLAYLWIDTLCIIQDEASGDDWAYESSKMGDIYANSVITLSADVSPNSEGGLIHRRSPLSVRPCRVEATWNCFPSGTWVVCEQDWTSGSHMRPLANRAWAFQEMLLSKCLLHFGSQVRWQCFCLQASETYPEGLDDPYPFTAKVAARTLLERNDRGRGWRSLIKGQYSGKYLTEITDRLAAFSGISRMINNVMGLPEDDFVVGLSRSNLLEDLLWVPWSTVFIERGACVRDPRHANTYIAPSWSWMSYERQVNFEHMRVKEAIAEVSSVDVAVVKDPFGPIRHASLKLNCALCPLISTSSEQCPSAIGSGLRYTQHGTAEILGSDPELKQYGAFLDHNQHGTAAFRIPSSYWWAPLLISRQIENHTTVRGLVLQQTGNQRGQYSRIGLMGLGWSESIEREVVISCLRTTETLDPQSYCERLPGGYVIIELV